VIGLDTNVIVRYVMQDDARQAAQATRLIESLTPERPGFLSLTTVVELGWVLESAYGLTRAELSEAFESVLRTQELVVEDASVVWQALRLFRATRADFADCLIARGGAAAGCEQTMTFDRAAAKDAVMTLLA
jgi:predicted nucleic-acid-binding protein